ncbi:MAG: SDR family oxidoreductase [Planktomarina sp.]|nr:SDR family oxidoreductase [Planktomarina sp.]
MNQRQFSLSGRVGLVTGSTGGIGRAIAEGLTLAGARIAINGRNEDKVNLVVKSLEGAMSAPFDVDDHSAAEDAIDKIIFETGRFDILVCSVGTRDRRSIAEIDASAFQDLLFTNTVSAYQLARAASRKMPDPKVGRLIFISSIASFRPFRGDPAYSASKAALESIVRSFCYEFGPLGITANAIAPGFVATEFNADLVEDPNIQEFVRTRIPAQRWARPEEVANAAVFLASDGASYINGHVLTVDAGLSTNL